MTRLLFILLVPCLLIAGGCAHGGDGPPLSLRGQNTVLRIDFSRSPRASQTQPARALADEELCYVPVGDATVECFRFGSLLVLAPDDGELLVADNPLDDLHAASASSAQARTLRALGDVGVIAASIERLPATLADYLGSDSDNPQVAKSACLALLKKGGAELTGYGHGGRFLIAVRLTQEGRKVLNEALEPPRLSPGARLVLSER